MLVPGTEEMYVFFWRLLFELRSFFAYYLLKVHLHQSSKIKSYKEVTKHQKSWVLLLCLLDGRFRIRIGKT